MIASELTREIVGGEALSLAQAARLLPSGRLGRPCHPSTLGRWITDGARLPSGAVVRLQAVRLASRWITSRAAVERFLAALTEAAGAPSPAGRCARERTAADADAARQLERLGL
jgi:hypothetical protein